MKKLLTILIALALYAPTVAKLLAYTECSIVLLTNSNPLLCDCNKIIESGLIHTESNAGSRQQELSIKTDWKYIVSKNIAMAPLFCTSREKEGDSLSICIQIGFEKLVFHPPLVKSA